MDTTTQTTDQPRRVFTGCDYCGAEGCRWENHPEAHDDVAAWQRQAKAEDF